MASEGLKDKYIVKRVDGKPVGPCFVLNYESDPHARLAMLWYATSCERDYPELARDLRATALAAMAKAGD